MYRQCFGTLEGTGRVSDVFPEASLRLIFATANEIQTALANIRTCPAPCEDGMVEVVLSSGAVQKSRCPILNRLCAYGIELESRLEIYLDRLSFCAGVPRRHIENFNALFETPALLSANKWAFKGFFVLVGGSGAGKSFAAAWAVRKYLRARMPDPLNIQTWNRAASVGEHVLWSSANRIIRDKELTSSACVMRLLVIDDLGREGDSSTRKTDLSDILSARYDAKLPTAITTELTLDDIANAYGSHIARKLAEDAGDGKSGGMIIDCDNDTLRRKEGEARVFRDENRDFDF